MAIKLFYQKGPNNFGDILSEKIVEAVSGSQVVHSKIKSADLVAIGSVADKAAGKKISRFISRGFKPLHVWGSGLINQGPNFFRLGLSIHALRGKKTYERFFAGGGVDLPLGDPGLLVSHFFPAGTQRTNSIICIGHINDLQIKLWSDAVKNFFPERVVQVVDVTADVESVLDKVSTASLVITTAMHPYIVAQSYDIPTILLETGGIIHTGGMYKFEDYCSAFDNNELSIIPLERFIRGKVGSTEIEDLGELSLVPRSEVSRINKDLMDSFPIELAQSN